MSKQKITITCIIAVLLMTVAIYWPGLAGPFVLDDHVNIVTPYIENPDLDAVIFTLTHNGSGMLGRGVSVLSFILTGLQYGTDPWGYKFHNLLLHLANGLLLFRLLYLTLPLLQSTLQARQALLIAGVTSTLWLLHPLLVSTVLYAVQRMTELAVLFTLMALIAYIEARGSKAANARFYVCGWLLFPLLLLMAILSKEIGVLIPVYVLVYEVLVFRSTPATLKNMRHQILWLVTFVAIPILAGSAILVLFFPQFSDYSGRTFTLPERLLTQLHVLAHYVDMILLPKISGMSLFQDDFPVTTSFDSITILLLCMLVSGLAVIWFLRNRLPVLSFGLAVFVASHLLESTFIPLELVFEHRNYLATAGLLLPPVYYLLQGSKQHFRLIRWLVPAYMSVFILLTWQRVQEWSSEDALINIAVIDHPDSSRTRTEYANYLFNRGRMEEGMEQLKLAAELSDQDGGPVVHQLFLQCLQGTRDEALLDKAAGMLARWPASVYVLNGLDNLISSHIKAQCAAITKTDLERLVESAFTLEDNLASDKIHGYLLRFKGILAFMDGRYAEGVIAMRMSHEISGSIETLAELFRYNLAFDQHGDAADTLMYIEELNRATFGFNDHVVDRLRESLKTAKEQTNAGNTVTSDDE